MNIYVGNLNYKLEEQELQDAFAAYGEVTSARIIIDKMTGRSKGFGFVEMSNDSEGQAAIEQLEGSDLKGRTMRVSQAKPPRQYDN